MSNFQFHFSDKSSLGQAIRTTFNKLLPRPYIVHVMFPPVLPAIAGVVATSYQKRLRGGGYTT